MRFCKELYPKVALIKAAYNFTDEAYVHLDADDAYYYVSIIPKDGAPKVGEKRFVNEMLAQSVRHEIYLQTKNIRELLLARAMASSVVVDPSVMERDANNDNKPFAEEEILSDWFSEHADEH